MGCSCSREGEVCLSNFCEGGACCAAPCSAEPHPQLESPAPLLGGDDSPPPSWLSGETHTACDGACVAHTYQEDPRPYGDAPTTHTQDMCASGGTVSYHTENYEASFIVLLVTLAMVCTVLVYFKQYRERRAKGVQLVVMATFVGEMLPGMLPIAEPVQLEQLSRMSDVVEAVTVSLVTATSTAAHIPVVGVAAQPASAEEARRRGAQMPASQV
jgi:hypothetical protein